MKHTLKGFNARALQARVFGRNPRRRAARRVKRGRVKAGKQFGNLPILMQEERGGKWNTVAAFKGDARGVRRAKSYANRYAAHERVRVRLIRR